MKEPHARSRRNRGAQPLLSVDAEAAERWTCNVFTGPKHFIDKALKPWGKQVREVTEGEVSINFLPSSAAPPPKQIDGIVAGTYDCAFIFHAFTAKRASGPQFDILPFISGPTRSAVRSPSGAPGTSISARRRSSRTTASRSSPCTTSPGPFWTSKGKPIASIDDPKSQKMWALAGTSSRTMKAAGVAHVSGPARPAGRVHPDQGRAGIAGITRGGIVNFAGIQFAKSGTFTSKTMMAPSFAWMVSKKRWDALSPARQKAIMSVSGEKLARAVRSPLKGFEMEEAGRRR